MKSFNNKNVSFFIFALFYTYGCYQTCIITKVSKCHVVDVLNGKFLNVNIIVMVTTFNYTASLTYSNSAIIYLITLQIAVVSIPISRIFIFVFSIYTAAKGYVKLLHLKKKESISVVGCGFNRTTKQNSQQDNKLMAEDGHSFRSTVNL